MKKTRYFLLVVALIILAACGIQSFIPKSETIEFRGDLYSFSYGDWEWMPVNEVKNNFIIVHHVDKSGNVDIKNDHYAKTYQNDKDTVFIFYDNFIFMKNNYVFPDPLNSSLSLEKITLSSDTDKVVIIDEKDVMTQLLRSYGNREAIISKCRFVEPENFDIEIYYKDYFASYDLGSICIDTSRKFGFRDFLAGGRETFLLPDELNEILLELIK